MVLECPHCGRQAPYRPDDPMLFEVAPQCSGCLALLYYPHLGFHPLFGVVVLDPTDDALPLSAALGALLIPEAATQLLSVAKAHFRRLCTGVVRQPPN